MSYKKGGTGATCTETETSETPETPTLSTEQLKEIFSNVTLSGELSPGKILISMELTPIHDGDEVPGHVWEPLFRGELDTLWDLILLDEGDEVIIHGSTVARMAFGRWVLDVDTGKPPATYRSDLDLMITSELIQGRLERSGLGLKQRTTSQTLEIGGIHVGVFSQKLWIEMNKVALDDIEKWAGNLTDEVQKGYFLRRAEAIRQLLDGSDDISVQNYTKLYPHESVGIKIRRQSDKSLTAHLIDPSGLTYYYQDGLSRISESATQQGGIASGYMHNWCNTNSVQCLLMEAFEYSDGFEGSNKLSVMTLESIPRVIVASGEGNILLWGDGEDYGSFFTTVYGVAQRMSNNEEVLYRESPMPLRIGDRVYEDVNEWFTHSVQLAFCRSCASDPEHAFDYVFLNLPLGNCISGELGKYFNEFHEVVQRDIPRTDFFTKYPGLTLETLPVPLTRSEEDTQWDSSHPALAQIRAALVFYRLVGIEYGVKFVSMQSLAGEKSGLYYPVYNKEPSGMSEIMAMIFVSIGWDAEKDRDKIEEVISNWKPEGDLQSSWRMTDAAFDMSLGTSEITEKMKYFQEMAQNFEIGKKYREAGGDL